MLYVYSTGFYNLIKEITVTSKKKRGIILNTLKVFYILLERCQKTDYKMLVQALCEDYDQQKIEQRKEFDKELEMMKRKLKEMNIEKRKAEIGHQEAAQQLQMQKDEYQRLNDQYMIIMI